ncbi:unnamed protein product [Amoebophrya sp. A25]|nr:unnamed protein product [Amoebophrya sp. A25]|eukprot:GSA25T00014896001.1
MTTLSTYNTRDNYDDIGESGLEANLVQIPGKPDIAFDPRESCTLVRGHESRPLTVWNDGQILLETFHPHFQPAEDFCITIAEPIARPESIQEYQITTFSMYSAVSSGLTVQDIADTLRKLSKNEVSSKLLKWIQEYAANLGKVKYLWSKGESSAGGAGGELLSRVPGYPIGGFTSSAHHYLESTDYDALLQLENILQERGLVTESLPPKEEMEYKSKRRRREEELQDILTGGGAVGGEQQGLGGALGRELQGVGALGLGTGQNVAAADIMFLEEEDALPIVPEKVWYVRVDGNQAEEVKRIAFENRFPLLEEYDYKADRRSPDLDITMRTSTHIREYQEVALSKMFTTPSRARSGIIVLPCGAGKTCVGITATATVKKRTLVLTSTAMAVSQWQQQFLQFSTIKKEDIFLLTAEHKSAIKDASEACVVISTYSMIGFSGRRGQTTRYILNQIQSVEWGLLVCDEVQVMPAKTFRQVALTVRSRCKLGLTATLVREDDLITDLQWLIGPKLYEANWHQLQDLGYLARVQCVEVWCEMSEVFYEEYLKRINVLGQHATARLLYTLNPIKLCIAEFLIRFHEQRGDKILVFSDNTDILKMFALAIGRYFIYGEVANREREQILRKFKEDPSVATLFLSKVGDNAIDLPSANVVIQINAHFASRRQEAQRLGRILRPKKVAPSKASSCAGGMGGTGAKSSRNASNAANQAPVPNAYFYTLVSKDTQEMYYATKRQQYLVEQGYAYKIVDTLYRDGVQPQIEKGANFIYHGEKAENDLLRHVLERTANFSSEADLFVGDDEAGTALQLGRFGESASSSAEELLSRVQDQERNMTNFTGGQAGTFIDD